MNIGEQLNFFTSFNFDIPQKEMSIVMDFPFHTQKVTYSFTEKDCCQKNTFKCIVFSNSIFFIDCCLENLVINLITVELTQ